MSRQPWLPRLWLLVFTGLALAEPLVSCEADAADWEECLPEEDTLLLQVGVRTLTTQCLPGIEFCQSRLDSAIVGELNGSSILPNIFQYSTVDSLGPLQLQIEMALPK
jgi:hypothetical protein